MRRFRAVGLGLGCALLLGCVREQALPEATAPPVAVAPVRQVDLEDAIGASGELLARLQTRLASAISGRITGIHYDEGAAVVEGDILLEIDPALRALEVAAASARAEKSVASLERAQREAARVRTLHESNVASQSRLDSAQTDFKLARASALAEQAQLGVAERALADANPAAPFAGLLGRRHVNLGQFVQVGDLLFDLISLDPIDLVFHLAEVDSGRVEIGQKVAVRVAPYPDRSFEASVVMVSPTIDAETRTLRVKASLPNPDGMLRPGLFAHADLGVAVRRGVVMVPEEAVLQRSDGAVLFALVGERVQRRVVKIGAFHEGSIEIVEGARPGERVVTRGHSGLVDGSPVHLVDGNRAAVSGVARSGGPASGADAEPGGGVQRGTL